MSLCIQRCSGRACPAVRRLAAQFRHARLFLLLALCVPAFPQGMASRGVKPTERAQFSGKPWNARFTNVAAAAGLTQRIVYGADQGVLYISETTSGGVAMFDYNNDGHPDLFFAGGTLLDSNPADATNRLYRNNGKGGFEDVTEAAGMRRTGWANGATVGDIDNDGDLDLFVTYWGDNALYRNNGDGTFTDIAPASGLIEKPKPAYPSWFSGATFLDYDRDGLLDLFVATYVDFDVRRIPKPGANPNCNWKGVATPCGPRGLSPGRQYLYHNDGNGKFTDVSERSGVTRNKSSFGLTAISADFDEDGWPDIYLACDSTMALFFRNNHNGTFTEDGIERGVALNDDGMEQAGMGLAAGDYNNDGRLDFFKTHFADDTHGLYEGIGKGRFKDVTLKAGIGVETRFIAWGAGIEDLDNDGWPDILAVTGNVYPDFERDLPAYPVKMPPLLFRNLANGKFEQLFAEHAGPALGERHCARGAAFGDFDNDGDLDVAIWNRNEPPSLWRNDLQGEANWLQVRLTGVKSNRAAIGAVVTAAFGNRKQQRAVLSQTSFTSANDLRLHFGLGDAASVELVVQWPSGLREKYLVREVNRVAELREGTGTALP